MEQPCLKRNVKTCGHRDADAKPREVWCMFIQTFGLTCITLFVFNASQIITLRGISC